MNQFGWFHYKRKWMLVNEICLVEQIWDNGLMKICEMGSSLEICKDVNENYETPLVSGLKITKHPCKWVMTLEITKHPLCHVTYRDTLYLIFYNLIPKGSISNFTNISIKEIKKSITSIKSFPNFHKHSPQIPSNLTIYPLIHTTLPSTYNSLKFLQIHSPNQTKPKYLLPL